MLYISEVAVGAELILTEDCFCEHYLHELLYYPREGLKEKKLLEGDKVILKKKWTNFYGSFFRVEKDDEEYDIKPENLTIYNKDVQTNKMTPKKLEKIAKLVASEAEMPYCWEDILYRLKRGLPMPFGKSTELPSSLGENLSDQSKDIQIPSLDEVDILKRI